MQNAQHILNFCKKVIYYTSLNSLKHTTQQCCTIILSNNVIVLYPGLSLVHWWIVRDKDELGTESLVTKCFDTWLLAGNAAIRTVS